MPSNDTWRDDFTGTVYRCSESFRGTVASAVSASLAEWVGGAVDVQRAADGAARYWRDDYYDLVFPLRLRRSDAGAGGQDLFGEPRGGALDLEAAGPPRGLRLEPGRAPAVLPARGLLSEGLFGDTLGEHELLADRLLAGAALANVLLRRAGVGGDDLHAVRLACLSYPLWGHTELREAAARHGPGVAAAAAFLRGDGPVPDGIPADLLRAAQTGRDFPAGSDLTMVLAAAQRIKHYVFETSGLNEIRGASTLLDQVTERMQACVDDALGPELVLRAAGSTLHFLCPEAGDWPPRIRRAFAEATGVAEVAVAALPVAAQDLFTREGYSQALERLGQHVEADRDARQPPVFDALPFETRCVLCGTRPAEGWADFPEQARRAVCRPCATKRSMGRDQRRPKSLEIVRDALGLERTGQALDAIGVTGVAGDTTKAFAEDLESLLPGGDAEGSRRGLLGVVYGDGDNFGARARRIESLAQGLQWTHRVAAVTRAATGLALAEATARTSWGPTGDDGARLERVPFQVLAIGGDDVSLFAYAPVALRFAQRFVCWTDLELAPGPAARKDQARLSFSLGVLLCDVKAPVQRTVDFAEDELLRWAKMARKGAAAGGGGRIAAMMTVTPEQIPADLEGYRETMYMREKGTADVPLCLTLRPFSAPELGELVDLAERVASGGGRGVLQRTVGAFFQTSATEALLFYVYQAARQARGAEGQLFAMLTEREAALTALLGEDFRFPATPLGRTRFGVGRPKPGDKPVWYSPLWDLLELVKILE